MLVSGIGCIQDSEGRTGESTFDPIAIGAMTIVFFVRYGPLNVG